MDLASYLLAHPEIQTCVAGLFAMLIIWLLLYLVGLLTRPWQPRSAYIAVALVAGKFLGKLSAAVPGALYILSMMLTMLGVFALGDWLVGEPKSDPEHIH